MDPKTLFDQLPKLTKPKLLLLSNIRGNIKVVPSLQRSSGPKIKEPKYLDLDPNKKEELRLIR